MPLSSPSTTRTIIRAHAQKCAPSPVTCYDYSSPSPSPRKPKRCTKPRGPGSPSCVNGISSLTLDLDCHGRAAREHMRVEIDGVKKAMLGHSHQWGHHCGQRSRCTSLRSCADSDRLMKVIRETPVRLMNVLRETPVCDSTLWKPRNSTRRCTGPRRCDPDVTQEAATCDRPPTPALRTPPRRRRSRPRPRLIA